MREKAQQNICGHAGQSHLMPQFRAVSGHRTAYHVTRLVGYSAGQLFEVHEFYCQTVSPSEHPICLTQQLLDSFIHLPNADCSWTSYPLYP